MGVLYAPSVEGDRDVDATNVGIYMVTTMNDPDDVRILLREREL